MGSLSKIAFALHLYVSLPSELSNSSGIRLQYMVYDLGFYKKKIMPLTCNRDMDSTTHQL